MDRDNLRNIARIRLKEARSLLNSGNYNGAYYLSGYIVECALKACIAKQTKQYEFPDKNTVNRSYTHNLENLFNVAGLWPTFQKDTKKHKPLAVNWTIVKDWSEESRYEETTTKRKASDLYSAIVGRQHGILRWIRQYW